MPSERDVRGTLAAVLPAGKERRVDEDSGIARLDGLLVIAQELRRLGVARLPSLAHAPGRDGERPLQTNGCAHGK